MNVLQDCVEIRSVAEPEEEPPVHPGLGREGGGLALLRGLMLRMGNFFSSFFNVFKIICEDIRAY